MSSPAAVVNACTNCSATLVDVYCAKCGERQPHHHDLTIGHIAHEAFHELVHLDSKLFGTLRALFLKPGFLAAEYFAGRKQRYIAPLRLFLTAFAIFFVAFSVYKPVAVYTLDSIERFDTRGDLAKIIDRIAAKRGMDPALYRERVDERWRKYVSWSQLANVLAVAIVLKVLFRRRTTAEHLVFAAHYLAFTYLVSVLLWPAYYAVGFRPGAAQTLLSFAATAVYVLYGAFAIRRFYGARRGSLVIRSGLFYAGMFVATLILTFGSMIAAIVMTR